MEKYREMTSVPMCIDNSFDEFLQQIADAVSTVLGLMSQWQTTDL